MSSQKLSTVCSRPALVARAPALTLTPLHRTIADDGDVEIDSDSECSVDDEDIAAEEGGSAADMLQHATYWDHFLAYVDAKSVPWAEGDADTDEYRKQRAVEQFNLGKSPRPISTYAPILTHITCLGSRPSGPRLEGAQAHGEELGTAH